MRKESLSTLIAILVTTLVTASMVLGACGPKAEPGEGPTTGVVDSGLAEPQAEEPVEPEETEAPEPVIDDPYADVDPTGQVVTYWHPYARTLEGALQAIITEFNATNEWGITVVGEYQGDYGDIFNKMLAVLKTDDAPNLVVAYQSQAATYQLAEALIDMDPLVYSPKWGLTEGERQDFFQSCFYQDVFPSFDNARLGFPLSRSMDVLYYNIDWLAELGYHAPPATPEEFKEMACAATAQLFSEATDAGSRGYELNLDASRFASWSFAHGGDVFDYATGQYSFDNKGAAEAMSFLQSLFDEGCATIVTEGYGDRSNFGAGTTLFTVGSSAYLPSYHSAVDEGAGFAWSVAAIPHTPEEPVMNIYGATVSISKSTPEKELASWLFLKHFTSPMVQAIWAQASNDLPVRASAANGLGDYFAANPAYQIAYEMLDYGYFEPSVPGYDFVRDMAEEAMAAIAGGADVASALAQLTEAANTSLAEQLSMVPESPDPWAKINPSGQTITFWHQLSRYREETLQEIITEFNATNDWGITVVGEYQGGDDEIFNKMLTVLNTEDAPNLVVASLNQAATYQLAEGLIDMDPLVYSPKWGLSEEERRDFIQDFFYQDIFPSFGNARLGFPLNQTIEVLYYNVDWLAELGYDDPPATPEEFKEMACAATAQPFSGATDEGSRGYELSLDASCFASWAFACGGDVFDYEAGQYSFDNEGAVAAMSFIQSLFDEGCATIVTESYGDQSNFGAGTTLFTLGSSAYLPYYQSAVDEGAGFAWSVAAIPHTTAEPVMNSFSASVSITPSTPEEELASWLFLKYFTSPEVQTKWVEASQYFLVRYSVADGLADYFAANPIYRTAFEMLQYSYYEPPVPGYNFVRVMVAEAMAAIAGGAEVTETLAQLTEAANLNLAEQVP
jgi:multiple sugar transport system substrate-binding protein